MYVDIRIVFTIIERIVFYTYFYKIVYRTILKKKCNYATFLFFGKIIIRLIGKGEKKN